MATATLETGVRHSVIFPEISGQKYGFIHVDLDGVKYLRFSAKAGLSGHPPIAWKLEDELGLSRDFLFSNGRKGGGMVDVDLEKKELRFYGSSGMFGKYNYAVLEEVLEEAAEDYGYKFE